MPERTAWRPPQYPTNVLYKPALRYRIPFDVQPARLAVSPDEKGIAIGVSTIDELIVLPDLEDLSTQVVLHLGNHTKRMRSGTRQGYAARHVAWCAKPTPRIYAAGLRALWALDPSTLETLPGFPKDHRAMRRRIWAIACLPDGGIAVSQGHGGPTGVGYIAVYEASGEPRWKVKVCEQPSHAALSSGARSLCGAPPVSIGLTNAGDIAVRSSEGIRVLKATDGSTVAGLDALAQTPDTFGQLVDTYKGPALGTTLLASSPQRSELLIVSKGIGTRVGKGVQPWRVKLPSFTFHGFPDLEALLHDDERRAKDPQLNDQLRSFERAVGRIKTLAYSPDGRTIVFGGVENEGVWAGSGNWNRRVLWVLRDGKLVDTLVLHTGLSSDVKILSDGRIISADWMTKFRQADIIVWAPRKSTP